MLVLLGLSIPASAQAVRFDISFAGQYTQPWHAIPDGYPCSIIGSGSQSIRFRGHRVVQLFGVGNPRHPMVQTSLPASATIERTDGSELTPSGDPAYPCNPLSAATCLNKTVRLKFVGIHVYDMYNRPSFRKMALELPNDVLEEAARNFQPTGDCAGPIPIIGFLQGQAGARWPGWDKLLRPGSVTHVSITRNWPATEEHEDFTRSGMDPNMGGYDFTAQVSGTWRYSVTLRNVCRTIRVPPRLRRQLAPRSSHGRICASGTS